jgi:uncharacterized RDD family membrane protein YckC
MSYRPPYPDCAHPDDDWLTEGVLSRRVFAWLIDMLLIGLIVGALWFVLLLFGLLTLGLGFSLFAVLPFVPFAYHFLFVAGSSATPGQQALGLIVRRNDDFGPPSPLQALIYTVLLLLVALFTIRKRALHDLASGLVVIRERALTRGVGSWNMQGG